ncbi:MAG: heavy metal translocating P-type ATPase metal-binding domain-containing protein [bacterium]
MSTARAATLGIACTHCGLSVPPAFVQPEANEQFCCQGCRIACEFLSANGLAEYKAFRDKRATPVRSTGRAYDEFDHPAFAELYVRPAAGGLSATELYLEGVHCASCVWLVERVPLLVPGVARAELDVRRSLARIEWNSAEVPLSAVARALDRIGYAPHPFRGVARDGMRRREDRAMLGRIGIAGAIAGNVMLASLALYAGDFSGMESSYERLFRWICFGLTVPALLGPGRVFFVGAWGALRARSLHMDLPIAIALGAGVLRGAINTMTDSGPIYFDGVTTLIFLLLTGRFLQQRGQRAATDAAELLFSLAPSTAHVVDSDGTEREVPAVALLPGMEVQVRAGESFPADGTVTVGSTRVNASLLTGESRPVSVTSGEAVFAGTLNISAPVRVRVDVAGETSRLATLLHQVEESMQRKAPVVAFANRMAGWFVAAVLALAVITFVIWYPRDPARAWDNAIALLIVTCPCALALATPLAVPLAGGRAARAGIFIKGGDALELLSHAGTLVIDKTGTVTEGRTALVEWLGDTWMQPLVLALEAGSSHPLASGFRRAWPSIAVPVAEDVTHHSGGGITGRVAGRDVVVGSPRFVASRVSGHSAFVARLNDPTLTPVFVAVDGQVVAAAGLGDKVRDDARTSLDAVRSRGWRTTMLSGDDAAVAAAVGARLGFAPPDAIGGATPEQKLAFIHDLRASVTAQSRATRGAIVMVGDGVNDAAAIAAADVGIGVHGGAEASLATAAVHLATPGLEPLVRLVDGAGRTMRVIHRNIALSLAYNLLGATLAMTGMISPLIAAIMMPASSLTVVLGSWLGKTFEVPAQSDAMNGSEGAAIDAPMEAAA